MAQLIISAAGAAIGFAVGGPTGAQIGWAVGSMVGASVNRPKVQGPRLQDLKVGSSQYGTPIPRVYGSPRVPGQIWWASDKREISSTSGGKGGGPEVTSYSYEVDLIIGLCDSELLGLVRVWSNGKLVYNADADADDATHNASLADSALWTRLTVYNGTATQEPDATYESAVGTDQAPGYRSRAYVFFEGLQLGNSGQLPNLTFEITTDGTTEYNDLGFLGQFDQAISGGLIQTEVGPELTAGALQSIVSSPAKFGSALSLLDKTAVTATNVHLNVDGKLWRAEGWFRQSKKTRLFRLYSVSPVYEIRIGTDSGFNELSYLITCEWGGSSGALGSGGTYSVGNNVWFHVAIQWNGTNLQAFLNGRFIQEITFSGQSGPPFLGSPFDTFVFGSATADSGNHYLDSFQFRTFEVDQISQMYAASTYGDTYQVPLAPFQPPPYLYTYINPETVTLREVVEEVCSEAGMPAGSYDAADLDNLTTTELRAIAVSQVAPARATLEQLATAYFFETTLRDKLYFRPRSESPVAEIPFADLASGADTPAAEPLALTIANDLELPPQVTVTYANLLDDHQQGTEYSDRIISGQAATQTIELAMGLTPAEAKGIADAIVVDAYASRTSTTIALPLEYAHLEAGDVVTVRDEDAAAYRLRLVRKREEGGLLQFEAVLDDQTALTSLQITDETQVPSGTVTTPGSTVFEALDIPILRDADDGPGYYVAAKGSTTNWPGAQIQSSINDTDFTTVAEVGESAVFGTASTTLATYAGVGFDERNSVTVDVGNGELSSSTRAAMLADETINAMVVGSEVIRFRDATLSSPGVYVLTGLLRGQRGTEWAIGMHGASERVALLSTSGLRRVATSASDIQQTRYLRGVTFGGIASDATSEAFTDTGEAVRPFSPVDARTALASDGTLVIDWKRRTRFKTNLTGPGGISAPLDYTFQPLFTASYFTSWETVPTGNRPAFIVRLYGDAARTQLVRTYYADSTAVTYPVADIAADFAESPSLYEDGVLYAAITHLSAFANIESAPLYATLNPLQ